jgi:hypothetical protein
LVEASVEGRSPLPTGAEISAATEEAVEVPKSLFSGPRDEYWAVDLKTGNLERQS